MSVSSEDIEEFIPTYPSIEDPEFSYKIFKRKEFHDLKLGPSEPVPTEQGVPFLSQELQARFFSPHTSFRSGLLFQGVGTGKTCASSLIVENFKNTLVDGKQRKKALVLVPNEDLERSYRTQVAYRCAREGIYQPKFSEKELEEIKLGGKTNAELSAIKKERRLRAAIGKTYEIRLSCN